MKFPLHPFFALVLLLTALAVVPEARAQETGYGVVAWGSNDEGQSAEPGGLTRVLALAAGAGHSLALKSDGTVVAWGGNANGQSAVPTGLTGVVAIAAGTVHSLAVKSDGAVVGWGWNENGQSTVPAGLNDVIAVAAGGKHSLALKSDGTVVVWGDNQYNQRRAPSGMVGVRAIAAGWLHSLALQSDGTVVAWGKIYNGTHVDAKAPDGLAGVIAIAAGWEHALALKADGTVVAWGYNGQGQCLTPAGLNSVVAIAAGGSHSLALKSDGTVLIWGNFVPATAPPGLAGVVAITAGGSHSLALVAGTNIAPVIVSQPSGRVALNSSTVTFQILAVGEPMHYRWSKNGMTVDGATSSTYSISNVGENDSGNYSVAITNDYGAATSSSALLTVVPLLITQQPRNQTPRAGWTVNFSVAVSGSAPLNYQWRKDGTDIVGATGLVHTVSPVQASDAANYSVVITNANGSVTSSNALLAMAPNPLEVLAPGTVAAWGSNESGQTNVPTGSDNVVAVAAGGGGVQDIVGRGHSLALKSDGTVVAWGDNRAGQSTAPVGLSNVVAIAAGDSYSLALKADGTVANWGQDWIRRNTAPAGLNSVIAIAAAGGNGNSPEDVDPGNNLALKADGTVVAWGATEPAPDGLSGVVAVAAGTYHSLALKSDGTVAIWNGSNYRTPTAPAGLNGVVAIAAGYDHSLALKADGTVVAWGDNSYGQSTAPVGLSNVVASAAGNTQSLALKSDGTVVAWGQIWIWDSEASAWWGEAATAPAGLTAAVAIAAGGGHSLALITNPPSLSIMANENNLVLAWPLWAANFTLQSTTNFADQNSWTPVLTIPVVEGSQQRVSDTISGAAKFYRLVK